MAKRISEIAKDLGVPSKAVIDKCIAEGVPRDIVKGHMSTVSAGLEASVREWFAADASASEGGGGGTAVETTTHVDATQVKSTTKRTARKGKGSGPADDEGASTGGDGTGGETPTTEPAPAAPAAPAPTPTAPVAPPRAPVAPRFSRPSFETNGFSRMDGPPTTPLRVGPIGPPIRPVPVGPAAAQPPAPGADDGTEGPHEIATRAAAKAPEVKPPAVPAPAHPAAHVKPPQAPGSAAVGGGGAAGPAGAPAPTPVTGHGPRTGGGPGGSIRPAPMNVPIRPTSVAPAGPQLQVRAPVKLSGPKVVRVEAPEMLERPRPRRDAGDAPGRFGPGAAGPRPPGSTEEDDRRRGGGGGAGGAGKPRAGAGPAQNRANVPPRRRARSDAELMGGPGIYSEQDLADREARLSRASGFLKQRRQQLRKQGHGGGGMMQSAAETGGAVKIAAPFTIKDLSATTGVKAADIIKKLFMQGVMATVNSGIDPVKAQEIMIDFDIELEVVAAKTAEEVVSEQFKDRKSVDVRPRGPIVTILGHVDHGKTSLLDKIRNANVAAGEAGGITQATSAFRTPVTINGETKHILFLDTPGHEAFTSMRARGAAVTDVVVLVVSAPEGVMPQTIESINHAKAAGVPIVVALNKIDRPDATEARVNQTMSQLATAGLNPVEWGGDTEIVRTSATKGTGIDQLLEILDLQGQVLELEADFGGPARGTVVEARMEEGRGPVANVIVQEGELNVGDFIVVGRAAGKVRDIVDDRGQRHKSVGPATTVRLSGFDDLPNAGDKFYIVESLRQAQEAAEQRRQRERETQLAAPKVTLDSLLSQMKDSDLKEIRIVLKADVQGSVDVLKHEIERVSTAEIKTRVLHAAVGGITESDVLLADASRAIVIGFNVIPGGKARQVAEQKSVEIRTYQIIYEITDDIRKAAEGLLEPERKTQILGHAEVRAVFKITRVGAIAGCFVTDGVVERDASIRVTRNGIVIENDRKLEQLKRVKDDAKEVRAGLECGMKIVGYDDIKEGDVLECYKTVEVKRTLGAQGAERK